VYISALASVSLYSFEVKSRLFQECFILNAIEQCSAQAGTVLKLLLGQKS